MPTLVTDLTLHQPPHQLTRGLINGHYLMSFALLVTFETLKNSRATTLFHYLSSSLSNFLYALVNALTPQSPFPRALLWSSKGDLFITLASVYRILIGLHHPLTIWSIRCGLLVFYFAFSCVLGFSFPLCDHLRWCCFPFPPFNRVILFINPPFFIFLSYSLQLLDGSYGGYTKQPCPLSKPSSKVTQTTSFRKPLHVSQPP